MNLKSMLRVINQIQKISNFHLKPIESRSVMFGVGVGHGRDITNLRRELLGVKEMFCVMIVLEVT